jgi:hypothetical protein
VDDTQAATIIEKTKEEAAARAKEKKSDGKQQGPELPGKEKGTGGGAEDAEEDDDDDDDEMPVWDSAPADGGVAESKGATAAEAAEEAVENREPWFTSAPEGVEYETLQDGSTAFIVAPGMRLKLDLSDLMDGGPFVADCRAPPLPAAYLTAISLRRRRKARREREEAPAPGTLSRKTSRQVGRLLRLLRHRRGLQVVQVQALLQAVRQRVDRDHGHQAARQAAR